MCGISIAIQLRHAQRVHCLDDAVVDQLSSSLDTISHRGPDSRGIWMDDRKRVALGHVRLSILDLTLSGAQPLHDKDSTIHAVVNGEFYDHEQISRDMTERFGYQFTGSSDSEIVIALYKYYGLSFMSHLRGEFAVCLYDSSTNLFIAARDRYGIKPLFWTVHQDCLLVASEAKAFLPFGWKPEWDVKSILEAGWSNDQRTLFRGVRKVPPGEYLLCHDFEHFEGHQYWDSDFLDKHTREDRTELEMIQGVQDRMLESIRLRLRADVPVDIYLSGGIHSSAVAGMACKLVEQGKASMGSKRASKLVDCFTIAFDEESGYDESHISQRTADWLGVKLHKKHMNETRLASYFEDAVWHAEHHWGELNFVGKFALSELARDEGFKVILSGEGADEIFGGYNTVLSDYLLEPDLAWPQIQASMNESVRETHYIELSERVRTWLRGFGSGVQSVVSLVPSRELNGIQLAGNMAALFPFNFPAAWTSCYGVCDALTTVANNINGRARELIQTKWHTLHSALYVWTKGHLPDVILACMGDRMKMGHSVEGRTPFLDHVLTEYVNGLPQGLKIRWAPEKEQFVEKWILREASKPFVLPEVYGRTKHYYSALLQYPEDGPMHKLMARLMTRENIEALGFVDCDKASKLEHKAFVEKSKEAFRQMLIISELVVLGKRFGVKEAKTYV